VEEAAILSPKSLRSRAKTQTPRGVSFRGRCLHGPRGRHHRTDREGGRPAKARLRIALTVAGSAAAFTIGLVLAYVLTRANADLGARVVHAPPASPAPIVITTPVFIALAPPAAAPADIPPLDTKLVVTKPTVAKPTVAKRVVPDKKPVGKQPFAKKKPPARPRCKGLGCL
jgi:hypothetical protein